jgi:hypothetical protein
MSGPTRYLVRALGVLAYGLACAGFGLACAGFIYRLSEVPAAHYPLTLLQAVTLPCLAGLVAMVVRAMR